MNRTLATIAAITTLALSACATSPITGLPVAPTAPAKAPCEGTHLIIHGFGNPTSCDLTPPQELHVTVEHVAPWTPIETDTFFTQCANAGGTVTDAEGDAWLCSNIDY